jgi:hypothetical protein
MLFFASQQNSATFIVIVTSGNGHLEKKESVKINFKNKKNFDSLLLKKKYAKRTINKNLCPGKQF